MLHVFAYMCMKSSMTEKYKRFELWVYVYRGKMCMCMGVCIPVSSPDDKSRWMCYCHDFAAEQLFIQYLQRNKLPQNCEGWERARRRVSQVPLQWACAEQRCAQSQMSIYLGFV